MKLGLMVLVVMLGGCRAQGAATETTPAAAVTDDVANARIAELEGQLDAAVGHWEEAEEELAATQSKLHKAVQWAYDNIQTEVRWCDHGSAMGLCHVTRGRCAANATDASTCVKTQQTAFFYGYERATGRFREFAFRTMSDCASSWQLFADAPDGNFIVDFPCRPGAVTGP